jgi:hypothetical protein
MRNAADARSKLRQLDLKMRGGVFQQAQHSVIWFQLAGGGDANSKL